ncbi:polyprotein of EF-Ts, chloroplastic-like [Miscanthus floridulus]|uniref:polyprotein of EF-Ts, chloroplastic-like n=1 Tax=Miscanthus floridulus TaxID=154761 RepID=UPI00345ABBC4
MTPSDPIDGIRMSASLLSNEEILRRVRETVEGRQRIEDLFPIQMRPSWGYISLAIEAATEQVREEAPTPHEAGPLESSVAEVSLAAEATEGKAEAPWTSEAEEAEVEVAEAEVAGAEAAGASEAMVADARAPQTTEVEVVEVGAPGATEAKAAEVVALGATEASAAEAVVGAVEPAAQGVEMEAGQASMPLLVQDPPSS